MISARDYILKSDPADMKDREAFYIVLSEGMTLTNMSIDDIADRFDIDEIYISEWLAGQASPNILIRRIILSYFQTKLKAKILPKKSFSLKQLIKKVIQRITFKRRIF